MGELSQLRRDFPDQSQQAQFLRPFAGQPLPKQPFLLQKLVTGIITTKVVVETSFQVQDFQLLKFPQLCQHVAAVEGTPWHSQCCHASLLVDSNKGAYLVCGYRDPPAIRMLGNFPLHRGRFGGQEGLTEPVAVQDLEDSAVVGGRGRAPHRVQRVGQIPHTLHMVVVHVMHGPVGIHSQQEAARLGVVRV